jgi:phage shock protein C
MQTVQHVASEAQDYQSEEPQSLFGICQAAGEDLGVNPMLLRVGLIGVLFFNPALMLGAYVGLGMVVGGSRPLFPKPGSAVQAGPIMDPASASALHFERKPELVAA